jgi:secreted Zn-dependent insulinase-like peptidase
MNAIFADILIEKITKRIGYEATLADISYSCKVFENIGLKFKFKGYNDKLAYFILLFFKTLQDLSSDGLSHSEKYLLENAYERKLKTYINSNLEIDQRTTNNRLLLLLQDDVHSDVIV